MTTQEVEPTWVELNGRQILQWPATMEIPKETKVLAKFMGDSSATYEIRQGKDDVLYCTCPSWPRKTKYFEAGDCKHLARIRQAIVTGDTTIFESMN